MNDLVKLLPGNLRIDLVRFRYKDLLSKFPFLSNRFLLTYLEKLKKIHYEEGDIIFKKSSSLKKRKPMEIIFCIEG
jgi:hypothetical protein